jgi:DNA-binding protein HU-beta
MTKADIINHISLTTGYDKKTTGIIVEKFAETIKRSLAKGENVYMRGFGSFITKTRKAKIARNITESRSIAVPEHQIASFKPAKEFAETVRNIKK